MPFSNAPLTQPDAEDFRRIGLRRDEFRPLVIRLALMRSAQLLGTMRADGSLLERAQKLSEVLTSGYRVMDPRRRGDAQQRAMLGRLYVQVFEESVRWGLSPATAGEGDQESSNRFLAAPGSGPRGQGLVVAEPLSAENLVEEGIANLCGLASFAPVAKTDMLPAGDLARWRATLSAEDLLNRPLRLRAVRALRKSAALLSPGVRIAMTLLAASILLVMSWRMAAVSRGSVSPTGVVVFDGSVTDSHLADGNAHDDQADRARRPIPTVNEDRVATLAQDFAEGTDDVEAADELKMLGSEPLVPPAQDPFALDPLGPDPLRMEPLTESVALEPVPVDVHGGELLEIRPLLDSVSQTAGLVPSAAVVVPISSDGRDSSTSSVSAIDSDADVEMASAIQAAGSLVTDPMLAKRVADLGFWKPSAEQLAVCRSDVERKASERIGRLGEACEVYRQIAREAAEGSVEGWVAWLNAGQAAIFERRFDDAQRVVTEMAVWTGLDALDATCETAAWATAEVSMGEPLKAVSEWLDRRIRFGLLEGNLALADKLQGMMQEMGIRNRDQGTVLFSREWRDVLDRCRRLQASCDALGPNPNDVELGATERLAAGRYWALVRRDWTRALPHLAAGSAGRLSRLAMTESLIVGRPDPDTAIGLAEGYLSEGSKYKGWLAESLAVHAHELLISAASSSESATATLDLRRRASAIEALYPQAFVPLEATGKPEPGTAGGVEAATAVDPIEQGIGRFRLAFR